MSLEEKNKTTGGIENDDTQDNEFLKELERLGEEDGANEEPDKTLTEEEKQRERKERKEPFEVMSKRFIPLASE